MKAGNDKVRMVYKTPRLKKYGTVVELTLGAGSVGSDMGAYQQILTMPTEET